MNPVSLPRARTMWAAFSGIVAVVGISSAANAACAPAADGTPNPAAGATVTCSGATNNQNGTDGYGSGNQTGIIINVLAGATVTGSGNYGINVDNATVSNAGGITGTAAAGIRAEHNVAVTNDAGATILGGIGGVVSNSGLVTVTNAGSISGGTNYGVFGYLGATVTNAAGATISGDMGIGIQHGMADITNAGNITGTTGYAVYAYADAVVRNSGSMTGALYGIWADQTVTVTNAGTIVGNGGPGISANVAATVTNQAGASITGSDYGVRVDVGSAFVTNYGNVTGTSLQGIYANINATVFNGASGTINGGIGTNVGFADVTNYGSIDGTGFIAVFGHTDVTLLNGVGANIIGGVNNAVYASNGIAGVVNSGSITSGAGYAIRGQTGVVVTNNAGGLIQGGDTGIRASFGAATVTNFGTIAGTSADGIYAGTGGSTVVNGGAISGGTAAIRFAGSGNELTLLPGSAISGLVLGTGGDVFQLGGTGTATFDASSLGPAAQYRGFGFFNKIGSSAWTLTGTSTYAGQVNVNGGTLAVDGDIASASSVTVNAGGTLGGNGIVGVTTVNGGALAPGNSIGTLTVQGNLVFTTAASFMVEMSGSTADRAVVTGTATLAGTVRLLPAASFLFNTPVTILTAAGFGGTTFDAVAAPIGIAASLIYSATSVQLSLTSGLAQIAGLNRNQRAVATALDAVFNGAGGVSAGFGPIFAGNVPWNLTQASGEAATGSQQMTFNSMNLFMGVMTDPFMAGRIGNPPGAVSFAEDSGSFDAYAAAPRRRSGGEREAHGMMTKAATRMPGFASRWDAWAAGFGGGQTSDGNAGLGSNTTTSRIGAVAAGADYRLSSQTVVGFALAGGGTSFSVANGLGSGRSDLFQAGAFLRHSPGRAYLSAALAYGWQDIATDRTVTIAGVDRLHARFNANAFSGRIESGYRFVTPWMGLAPYAAAQFTTFDLPAYAEQVLSGAQYLCARLCRQGCHGVAIGTRSSHRQVLGHAGRRPDVARPRGMGA
ncbi:autotransporter outer membrane beta-barrel domain-containing protein [Bradyrhizobium sediminis]|uniref:autotransporter outer membrane beta-barrel domain-containing protein n=1 Tax=Bradyrhizobium sediminis TaxID=2840469 RepID=UPI003FA3CC34